MTVGIHSISFASSLRLVWGSGRKCAADFTQDSIANYEPSRLDGIGAGQLRHMALRVPESRRAHRALGTRRRADARDRRRVRSLSPGLFRYPAGQIARPADRGRRAFWHAPRHRANRRCQPNCRARLNRRARGSDSRRLDNGRGEKRPDRRRDELRRHSLAQRDENPRGVHEPRETGFTSRADPRSP